MVNDAGISRCSKAFLLNILTVSLLWGIGLLIGISFASHFRGLLSSLMCSAVLQPVSIFFPLMNVLFLFVFLICKRGFLLFVCFIKAICFGFASMSLSCLFGSSGWLVRGLLLFSDTVMCLYLLNCILCFGQCAVRKCKLSNAMVCVAAFLLDYLVISPFAGGLF